MNDLSDTEILDLSLDKQFELLEHWYKKHLTSAEDMLVQAKPMLVIYSGVSELWRDAIENFSDFYKYHCIVEHGHITEERYEELVSGAVFSEDEKEFLLQALKDEMLQNMEVEELQRFYVEFNGNKLCATYIGMEHPASNDKTFFGIYKDDKEAIKAAEKIDLSEEPFWL